MGGRKWMVVSSGWWLSKHLLPPTTHPVDQVLEGLVEFYGHELVVQVDEFEVVDVAETVVDGLDAELAPRVGLELEDLAADGQVLGHPLEAPVLAGRVELAACCCC